MTGEALNRLMHPPFAACPCLTCRSEMTVSGPTGENTWITGVLEIKSPLMTVSASSQPWPISETFLLSVMCSW